MASTPSALPLPDYEQLDATALADLIRNGALHPGEVLEAAIARLERARPLNAIAMTHFEKARAEAARLGERSAAQRQADATQAPLRGVPFLLKDLGLALEGTVTTQGCAFFKDAVADHDSTLVQRYRAAGLNIFGKTTSPEFGQTATTESRLFGLTRNPWNHEISAGGSSGGAAGTVDDAR
jgi:Asp-tRNA(Asn)/Glu-tRNA(Gln) amidotransferase A subunit family amidase